MLKFLTNPLFHPMSPMGTSSHVCEEANDNEPRCRYHGHEHQRSEVRRVNTRYFMVAVLAAGLLCSPAAQAKKPIVAVFDIEFQRVRKARKVKSALRDYLSARLVASGRFQVVPPGQLHKRMRSTRSRRGSPSASTSSVR